VLAVVSLLSAASGPAAAQTQPVQVGSGTVTVVNDPGVSDPVGVSTVPSPVTTSTAVVTTSTIGAVTTSTVPTTTTILGATSIPVSTVVLPVSSGVPSTAVATESTISPVSTTTPSGTSRTTTTTVSGKVATTAEALSTLIAAAIKSSTAKSASVLVYVDGIGDVYQRSADVGVIPASTQKIYVGASALELLGSNAKFVTEVRPSVAVAGPTLNGDLVLKAGGDPSFGTKDLKALAIAVAKSGIKEVSGSLLVDDEKFDDRSIIDSWKAKFVPGEVGLLSAFTIDGNHRSDSAVRSDPALANLVRFQTELSTQGVNVLGGVRHGNVPGGGPVIASITSASLRDLVGHMLKKSDNTYAELLLKQLGALTGIGTTASGVSVVAKQFARFGIAPPTQVDGSGLSSVNRSSARQQVDFLRKVDGLSIASDFRKSLAISCVDGTVKSRLCKTSASGIVFGKTGTLDYITGFNGYTKTASGRRVTFSFLMNGCTSTSSCRAAIDASLIATTSSKL
jgi:serine-type D-Ala-D-Ala carboxypeptidase/endopeptidase (penicillin-binding protein 4)